MKNLILLFFGLTIFLSCTNSQLVKKETDKDAKPKVEWLSSKVERKKNAPFSDAVRVSDLLFLAGQIGYNNDSLKLAYGGIKAETTQALENIKDVLELHDSDMEHVVKCTVILADIDDFSAFNEVFRQYFPKNKPARTTFAANLVMGAKIEIEVIAVVK